MQEKESILINGYKHYRYRRPHVSSDQMIERSRQYYLHMDERRSIREYSAKKVPREVIENIIRTASTAPSGAHKQPWTFCAVADPELKFKIRSAAEAEEKESYQSRMSDRWKKDLLPMATDANKPFLEEAPWLIIVFKKAFEYDDQGNKVNNYYVNESTGIAAGLLISAIHHAGLVTLTHTPSPMNFLGKILNRPDNERAFLVLPVGYHKEPVFVPDLNRKKLNKISVFFT